MFNRKKLDLEQLVASLVVALAALVLERRRLSVKEVILGVVLALAALASILSLFKDVFP